MSKIITLEELQEIAKSHGGKCLSTKYVDGRSPLNWECSQGHIWTAISNNIKNNNAWCPKCGGTSPLSIEEMHLLAESKGGKCISSIYTNKDLKLEWECSLGHRWFATPGKIKHANRWCPDCGGSKKLIIEDMHKIAKENNGKCLSTIYVDSKSKLEWECEFNHKWFAAPYKINYGTWCPTCIGRNSSIIDCQNLAKERNGKCLSVTFSKMKDKLEWECDKGHRWFANTQNIKYGNWCAKCVYINNRLTLEEMQELAKVNNGFCLSTEYRSTRHELEWKCDKNHTWFAKPGVIKGGSWCPLCHTSFVETHCREIFEEFFQKSFPRKRHTWLRNNVSGLPLELDGYCAELNIAFEYQGQQHYKEVPGFKIGPIELVEIKRKDALKVKLCKENNVELIVIDLILKPTRDKIYLIIQNLLKINNLI